MTTETSGTPWIEFDAWAKEPPGGDWRYVLDAHGIGYRPGWWPFTLNTHNAEGDGIEATYLAGCKRRGIPPPLPGCGVMSVRLSPDTGYGSTGRNEYVTVWPDWTLPHIASADLKLWVREQGMGGMISQCSARLDMQAGTFTLDWFGREPVCADQAEVKAARVLSFLAAERERRDACQPAPVTAYDRWISEVGCAMHPGGTNAACGRCAAFNPEAAAIYLTA